MDEALPRDHRLRRRIDFLRVQEQGARVSTKHFVLLVAARLDDPTAPTRFGVVVSKRIGNAVARNGVKRRLREAWRRRKDRLPDGLDVIAIARGPAADLDGIAIANEIDRALPDLARRAAKFVKNR